jgi:hypothetical protein
MPELTPEGARRVAEIAAGHGVSPEAARTLLTALAAGGGTQAQFSHPELGGMGQWSQGGMVMVGDMFDNALKARVDALCTELAGLLRAAPFAPPPSQSQSQSQGGRPSVSLFVSGGAGGAWWPEGLGAPSSTGAQNDLAYAVFPASRRLAIDLGGRVALYDTGEHVITGVSQQQSGDRTLTFTSQHGPVRLDELRPITTAPVSTDPAATDATPTGRPATPAPDAPRPTGAADILATIERLAELRRKDILSEAEFAAKKTELLSRL